MKVSSLQASLPSLVCPASEMFRKLSETEEWQNYTRDEALMADFLTGDELQAYFLEEREKHAKILQIMDGGSS